MLQTHTSQHIDWQYVELSLPHGDAAAAFMQDRCQGR